MFLFCLFDLIAEWEDVCYVVDLGLVGLLGTY